MIGKNVLSKTSLLQMEIWIFFDFFLLIGVMSVLHIQREWRTQYVRKQSLLNVIPIPVAEIKKPKAHEY